jgi:hypothetical protein
VAGQWEYKLEVSSADTASLTKRLNEESADGWDLVTVFAVGGESSPLRLVFRHELTNPTWNQ